VGSSFEARLNFILWSYFIRMFFFWFLVVFNVLVAGLDGDASDAFGSELHLKRKTALNIY